MILEFPDGKKIHDPDEKQIKDAISGLGKAGNNSLTLKKGMGASLKVVREMRSRYYFYSYQGISLKQSIQPVSQHVAGVVLTEYAQGKTSWENALRLRVMEEDPFGSIDSENPKHLSDYKIQGELQRLKLYIWMIIGLYFFVFAIMGMLFVIKPELANSFFTFDWVFRDFETWIYLLGIIVGLIAFPVVLINRMLTLGKELASRE